MALNPDDLSIATLSRALDVTEMHGMALDPGGSSRLWIADNGHKFVPENGPAYSEYATTGQVVSVTFDGSQVQEIRSDALPLGRDWRPSGVAIDGESGHVWVADGYGHSLVHCFDSRGNHLLTLDGSTTGRAFSTPHAILIDQRSTVPLLLVADRGNHRIVAYTLSGNYVRTLGENLLTSPSGMAVDGANLWVTELFGALVVINDEDEMVGKYGTNGEQHQPSWPNELSRGQLSSPKSFWGTFRSPHGIAVDAQGRVVVTEWVIGGRVTILNPL